jgi:hypothetical protein
LFDFAGAYFQYGWHQSLESYLPQDFVNNNLINDMLALRGVETWRRELLPSEF